VKLLLFHTTVQYTCCTFLPQLVELTVLSVKSGLSVSQTFALLPTLAPLDKCFPDSRIHPGNPPKHSSRISPNSSFVNFPALDVFPGHNHPLSPRRIIPHWPVSPRCQLSATAIGLLVDILCLNISQMMSMLIYSCDELVVFLPVESDRVV